MYDELATDFNHVVGTCTHCKGEFTRDPRHDYMLTKELWKQVHPEGRKGFLHDTCLQARAQAKGLTLTAESFTTCLCYVNRHIHLPRPQDAMLELANYFADDTPEAQTRPRPHFGYVVASVMLRAAECDRMLAVPGMRPSVFSHLFRSVPAVLGTERIEA